MKALTVTFNSYIYVKGQYRVQLKIAQLTFQKKKIEIFMGAKVERRNGNMVNTCKDRCTTSTRIDVGNDGTHIIQPISKQFPANTATGL